MTEEDIKNEKLIDFAKEISADIYEIIRYRIKKSSLVDSPRDHAATTMSVLTNLSVALISEVTILCLKKQFSNHRMMDDFIIKTYEIFNENELQDYITSERNKRDE